MVGSGTVSVIRERLDQNRNTAGTIAFILNGFEGIIAAKRAGAFRDRPFDIVIRDPRNFGFFDRRSQLKIPSGIATRTSSNNNLPRHFGKNIGPFCIDVGFLTLDGRPFTVSRHLGR